VRGRHQNRRGCKGTINPKAKSSGPDFWWNSGETESDSRVVVGPPNCGSHCGGRRRSATGLLPSRCRSATVRNLRYGFRARRDPDLEDAPRGCEALSRHATSTPWRDGNSTIVFAIAPIGRSALRNEQISCLRSPECRSDRQSGETTRYYQVARLGRSQTRCARFDYLRSGTVPPPAAY
jgi:hypothetical protein